MSEQKRKPTPKPTKGEKMTAEVIFNKRNSKPAPTPQPTTGTSTTRGKLTK